MPADEALDLPDVRDPPRPRRRPAHDEYDDDPRPELLVFCPLQAYRPIWILALAAGFGSLMIAFNSNAIHAAIFARIVQAEEARVFAEEMRRWVARMERLRNQHPQRIT
ncbi:MAG TPA: hypothetical protein VH092_30830 [Urbifossiella sp.]|nr:hypothetical protein [Urbifossiella sp.]